MAELTSELLSGVRMNFDRRYRFHEAEDILDARIKNSLPAMTEFLLDDSIPDFEKYSWGKHPLFLSKKFEGGWGREVWIKDIEHFQHREAYTNLREVWLHDSDKYLAGHALCALASFGDAKLLPDLKKKFKDSFYDWKILSNYVEALQQIDNPSSVDLMMEAADYVRNFNDAKLYDLRDSHLKEDKAVFHYPGSVLILGMMTSLGFMKNEKVKPALKTLRIWFSGDLYLNRRYSQSMENLRMMQRIETANRKKIILPEKPDLYFMNADELVF